MGVVGSNFAQKLKVNIGKWSILRAGSAATKIKALRPCVLKSIFWRLGAPRRPMRRPNGIFDQIWSQKLGTGHTYHMCNYYLKINKIKIIPTDPSPFIITWNKLVLCRPTCPFRSHVPLIANLKAWNTGVQFPLLSTYIMTHHLPSCFVNSVR